MALNILAVSAVAGAGAAYHGVRKARDERRDIRAQQAIERQALAELQAEDEPVMPIANDENQRRARRRSITAQMRRRGRQSTILTDSVTGGDTLGA